MDEKRLRELCAAAATAGDLGVVVGYPYDVDLDPPSPGGGPPLAFFVSSEPLILDAGRAVGVVVRAHRLEADGAGVPFPAYEWEWVRIVDVEPVDHVVAMVSGGGWRRVEAADVLRLAKTEECAGA